MKRDIYSHLLHWKEAAHRKPLMMYGARQVGKTYILKEFGRNEFENMVYVNCYKNPEVETLFGSDANLSRILLGLSALSGQEIVAGKTLLFFDEVQELPDVVSSLKYFCEEMPSLAVVAAGSLLGVMNMNGRSFPTGKVEIMRMYPMSFTEFIEALGEKAMVKILRDEDMAETANSLMPRYVELLRQYFFVGGMPEAVVRYIETQTPAEVRKVQKDILTAYDADIAKHAGRDTQKARMIFESIPSQLAKENKKFIFGALKSGARGSEFENAIQWLVDAGLVYKISNLSKVEMPLSFFAKPEAFKLFLLDVGLLGAMADIPPSLTLIGEGIFAQYKGAFTENYVLTQMLSAASIGAAGVQIYYYAKSNSTLELDFVVQAADKILPIEVKAESNVKSKSLRQFVTVDAGGTGMRGMRFSMLGFKKQEWMDNVPLWAVGPTMKTLVREA